MKERPLPFDGAPGWLRRLVPARWGGRRASSSIDEPRRPELFGAEGVCFSRIAAKPIAIPDGLRRCLARDTQTKLEQDAAIGFYTGKLPAKFNLRQGMGPASWSAVADAMEHDSLRVQTVSVQSVTIRFALVRASSPPRWRRRGSSQVLDPSLPRSAPMASSRARRRMTETLWMAPDAAAGWCAPWSPWRLPTPGPPLSRSLERDSAGL